MKRRTHTFISVAYETSLVVQMVKNLPAVQKTWFQFLGQEDPGSRERQPTSVFLPGKFHGQRNLAGYNPWDCKELYTHTQKSLSRVRLFATPWILAHQAPRSMRFSRHEYWSGLPFPSPMVVQQWAIKHVWNMYQDRPYSQP